MFDLLQCVCVCGQQLTNECRSYILCLCAPNTRTYHQANPRGLLCMPAGDNGRQSKHDSQSETRFFDLLVWLSLNWHAQATLQQISVATWSLRQQSAPAPGFPNAKPRKKISKGSVVVHAVVPHPDSLLSPSNGFGLCPQHDTKHREKTHRTSMDFVNVMSLASNQDILWIWYFNKHTTPLTQHKWQTIPPNFAPVRWPQLHHHQMIQS